MRKIKNNIPNMITSLRMLGAVALLFLPVQTLQFYVVYTFCGATDVLDGLLARKLKLESETGAVLDSVSDLIFYGAMFIKMMPFFIAHMIIAGWCFVALTFAIRIAAYVAAGIKFHRFAALHTYANKLTGALVFCVPYATCIFSMQLVCNTVCAVASLASLEELVIHLRSKEFNSGVKSIFVMQKAN